MNVQGSKYDLSRAKAILILIVFTLLYMMAYMDRSVMTVVVEQLKADIGLTDGQIAFFLPDYQTIKSETGKPFDRENLVDILGLFKIRSLILAALGFSAWVFLVCGLAGWMPALFMRHYELDAARAGSITGLIYVLGAIGGVIGGIFSDRWQKLTIPDR